jgi:hypothetical protein
MEGLTSGLSVKDRMKMFQKPAEDPKPKTEISTGVSIKDRQVNFANKPQPVNQFVPSSNSGARSSIPASNPQVVSGSSNFNLGNPASTTSNTATSYQTEAPGNTGLSVKERMALLQSNKTMQEKKDPPFVPSSQKSSFNVGGGKGLEKEENKPEVGLVNRLSSSFAPSPQVAKPEPPPTTGLVNRLSSSFAPSPQVSKPEPPPTTGLVNRLSSSFAPSPQVSKSNPFEEASNVKEVEKPQISTGMSIKERMAALQQSSKPGNERPSLNAYVPSGPSIADRINSVQESKVQSSIHRAKTEDVRESDVRGITSKFERQSLNEPPKHAQSINTGRTGGLDNDFRKKMEGMVFMPPPPGGMPVRSREREVEEVSRQSKSELVELDKPIRKRAAATFDDDFEF